MIQEFASEKELLLPLHSIRFQETHLYGQKLKIKIGCLYCEILERALSLEEYGDILAEIKENRGQY